MRWDASPLGGNAGQFLSTDGRKPLVHAGILFSFAEELLVPGSGVFGCRELPLDHPRRVGRSAKRVGLMVGPWTLHLPLKDGRFPNVEDCMPAADTASSRVELDAADAQFLTEHVQHLPCEDEYNSPVTLDLNGQVVVRARSSEQSRPTELVLCNSRLVGEPARCATNRRSGRAVALGLRELCFFGDSKPILAQDRTRRYVWMSLESEGAIPPAEDAVRIESTSNHQTSRHAFPRIKEKTMPNSETEVVPATTAAAPTGATRAKRPRLVPVGTPIEQAVALRDALRTAASQANELIRSLKRGNRQARLVQTTLDSLKALQKVAG